MEFILFQRSARHATDYQQPHQQHLDSGQRSLQAANLGLGTAGHVGLQQYMVWSDGEPHDVNERFTGKRVGCNLRRCRAELPAAQSVDVEAFAIR